MDALRLDALRWSAFALHSSFGLELGPPFLRLSATVRLLIPVVRSLSWWEIGVSDLAASLGLVIRF